VPDSDRHVLLAENLQKSYGLRPALRGLSFSLRAGRILGFLGPNGAGKTTSIRILTTILEPDAGRFTVNGIGSEHPDWIRRVIGVLPESLGLPRQITGLEYLIYFARLYGLTASEAKRRSLALLEEVGFRHGPGPLLAPIATACGRGWASHEHWSTIQWSCSSTNPLWAWIREGNRSFCRWCSGSCGNETLVSFYAVTSCRRRRASAMTWSS
jgi:hypothetical protein